MCGVDYLKLNYFHHFLSYLGVIGDFISLTMCSFEKTFINFVRLLLNQIFASEIQRADPN